MYFTQKFIASVIKKAGNLLLGKKMIECEYSGDRYLGVFSGEIFSVEFIRDRGCDGDGIFRVMGRIVVKATSDPRRPGVLITRSFVPSDLDTDLQAVERGEGFNSYTREDDGQLYGYLRYETFAGSTITSIKLPVSEPVKN